MTNEGGTEKVFIIFDKNTSNVKTLYLNRIPNIKKNLSLFQELEIYKTKKTASFEAVFVPGVGSN